MDTHREEKTTHRPPQKTDGLITFSHRLAGFIGYLYLRFVGLTSFDRRYDDPQALEIRRKKIPCVYAFWHNNQVFLAEHHRNEPIDILVSKSKDGEYIAQVMKWMGLGCARGSSSRGGGEALREMCSRLENGRQVGFTPDGPKGPVQSVQGGVVFTAQMSGAPIVPVAVHARRKIVFNSWDKFFVPLPFNSIVVVHGKPFYVDKNESMESAQNKVRNALNDVVRIADTEGARRPSWIASSFGALFALFYSVIVYFLVPIVLPLLILKFGYSRFMRFFGERFAPPKLPAAKKKRLWLHAASYGEWQALSPVVQELKSSGAFEFVVTTGAPEARRLIAERNPDVTTRLIPVDLGTVIKKWVKAVAPDALLLVEKEMWPNLLQRVHKEFIPIFVLNGRFSAKALKRWEWFRPLAEKIFSYVTWFFIRTDLDRDHFAEMKVPMDKMQVTGNTKFDTLPLLTEANRREQRLKLLNINDEVVCLLGGSTWPGEEEILVKVLEQRGNVPLRLILAPRRMTRVPELVSFLNSSGKSWSRWSEVKPTRQWTTDILLVDTIGDLKDLYAAADIAFVGKSLNPQGGQSPMEPAAAGIPIFFGPSMENFHAEADDLLKEGGARQVADGNELATEVIKIAQQKDAIRKMGAAAQRSLQKNQGGSRKIADGVISLLDVKR